MTKTQRFAETDKCQKLKGLRSKKCHKLKDQRSPKYTKKKPERSTVTEKCQKLKGLWSEKNENFSKVHSHKKCQIIKGPWSHKNAKYSKMPKNQRSAITEKCRKLKSMHSEKNAKESKICGRMIPAVPAEEFFCLRTKHTYEMRTTTEKSTRTLQETGSQIISPQMCCFFCCRTFDGLF